MAQWVSANFSSMLPSGMTEILDTISTLTDIVSIPLEAISAILDVAKTILVGLPPLDLSELVRSEIEDFKANLLGSGYYMLDMWDYPLHQLRPKTYGPDNTYGTFDVNGGDFSDFVQTIADALQDEQDPNLPEFNSSAAMVVLVTASGYLDDLNIYTEDGNQGQNLFEGMAGSIQSTAYALNAARWRGAMAKLRGLAEQQDQDNAPTRVDRVQTAFKEISAFKDTDFDLSPAPFNAATGDRFFENVNEEDINWEDDVMPVLETIEDVRLTSTYPDWRRSSLREIYPQIVDVIDVIFDPVLDLLAGGGTIKDQILALIQAIDDKITELTDIIDKIDEFIARIDDFLNLTGFHILFITTADGVDGLRDQLLSATNSPVDGKGWFAGFSLVVGGDAVAPFKALFSPLAS